MIYKMRASSLSPIVEYITRLLGKPSLDLPIRPYNYRIQRLYQKSIRDQWSFDDRYAFPNDFDNVNKWLGITENTRLAVIDSFSSFYYGERGAKIVSAQLTVMAPTNEASNLLATQTMDEARHTEAFEKIIGFMNGEIQPMNPFLNAFLSDIIRVNHFEDKLVGMNLLVEGLALSAFRMLLKELKSQKLVGPNGYDSIGGPIESILRDESRHVGFGVLFLPQVLNKLTWRRKAVLRLRQLAWLGLLYGSVKYHQKEMEDLGLDYLDLLKNLIEDHEKRVIECGGDALISTDKMQSLIPVIDKMVDKVKNGANW